MIKLTRLLLEVSLDQLKTQYVDTGKITDSEFTEIVDSAGGKTAYATWLTKKVADKIIKPEDLYKYNAYFKIFDRRKREYQHADINQYKTLQDIGQFISKSVELADKEKADPAQQKGVAKNDKYQEFYIGSVDGFNVYKLPKGREDLYATSCELGSGTQWCTATGKTDDHFKHYISKGPLFIFMKPSSDEKYQFSYETDSFMDKNDNSVITDDPDPIITKLFKYIETNQPKYRTPFDIKLAIAPDTITKEDLTDSDKIFTYKLLFAPDTITKDELNVNDSLILTNSKIKSLPDNLTVNGNLYLGNTEDGAQIKLIKLPDNLTVSGHMDIQSIQIINSQNNTESSIPNNLNVGENLYLGTNWVKRLEAPEIRKIIQAKGGSVGGNIRGMIYSNDYNAMKARLGREPIINER